MGKISYLRKHILEQIHMKKIHEVYNITLIML